MTPREALAALKESRDGDRIWQDNGRSITRYARLAGVRVVYIHVDLNKQESETGEVKP